MGEKTVKRKALQKVDYHQKAVGDRVGPEDQLRESSFWKNLRTEKEVKSTHGGRKT